MYATFNKNMYILGIIISLSTFITGLYDIFIAAPRFGNEVGALLLLLSIFGGLTMCAASYDLFK